MKQLVRSFGALGVLFFGIAATARPAFAETSHEDLHMKNSKNFYDRISKAYDLIADAGEHKVNP